ncbi:MAG: ATP-binding protein [Chloroflexi bacterium]|nr:ATP-binding protein [Chloroflexota bacterium]
MQNPYTHRSTVRDPQMFFGRTGALSRLFALLANGQSVSIVGDRRIGKSSLLYCAGLPQVQARIPGYDFTSYLFIYVDLQGSAAREPSALLSHLLRQLSRQSGGRFTLSEGRISPEAFEEAIFQLNQQGFTVVFLLDEFDCLTRNEQLDITFFSFLRYMATNYHLCLVVASHRRLADLCHTEIVDSPFFNIFAIIALKTLNENAARELINVPSTRAGYSLALYADWLLDMVGFHPFFLQIACFYLMEACRRRDPPDLAWAEERFHQEAVDHFVYAWEHADAITRERMQRAAWQTSGEYEHYLCASRVFREFVRAQAAAPSFVEIRAEDVEAALEHLWDTVWLAESPLTRLRAVQDYLVRRRMAQVGCDRGKAVHHALLMAMNQLRHDRGPGKTDKRWRGWYILHHKYVEGHSNRRIFMQLNLSERTFYRERKDAIHALTAVLESLEQSELQPQE